MRVTWKTILLSFILFIVMFWFALDLPQPYRMYLGIGSLPVLLLSFFLMMVNDVQSTDICWREFDTLKEDKEFVDYIEKEFENIEFNFNFKSQMVLGHKSINSRMAVWKEMKEKERDI